jgi:hypothetical protein
VLQCWIPIGEQTRIAMTESVSLCARMKIRLKPLERSKSFIADRYPNLRHCSGFEPPLSKRIGCDLIENPIACALLHDRTRNVAARSINGHETNAAPSDMGPSRLVGVIRYRGAHCQGLCS